MDQPKNHQKKHHKREDSEEVLYYFHAIPLTAILGLMVSTSMSDS